MRMPDVHGILAHAQAGNMEEVKTYFRRREGQRHIEDTKALLLDRVIEEPEKFHRKADLVETIGKGFNFPAYFKKRGDEKITGLMTMHAASPTPDTAKAGAILLAEYIKTSVLNDEAFLPQFIVPKSAERNRMTAAMEQAALKGSIIAIQNALVDIVSEQVENRRVTDAAGMLNFLSTMVKPHVSLVWTKKILSFNDVKQAGVGPGKTTLAPVFEP